MSFMTFIWLWVVVLAAVIEAAVPALVSVWFALGGLAAMIASVAGASREVQLAVFLIVSILALAAVRPLSKRLLAKGASPTNADRCLGKPGVVTEDIDNVTGTGRVLVNGNSWAALAEPPDRRLVKGNLVIVERIEGVKVVVKKFESNE